MLIQLRPIVTTKHRVQLRPRPAPAIINPLTGVALVHHFAPGDRVYINTGEKQRRTGTIVGPVLGITAEGYYVKPDNGTQGIRFACDLERI